MCIRDRPCTGTPNCTPPSPRSRAGTTPASSWWCTRPWPPCCTASAPGTTSRSARPSPAVPTPPPRTWSASSSTPWCCAPTCRGRRPSASCWPGSANAAWTGTPTRTSRSSSWSTRCARPARPRTTRSSRCCWPGRTSPTRCSACPVWPRRPCRWTAAAPGRTWCSR